MLYLLPILIGLVFGVIIDRPTYTGCRSWKEVGRTDGSKDITLSFWLKNQNVDVLHDTLMEVSTPGHKRYGQFLTQEEVQTIVAPRRESIETVKSWLERFGFEPKSGSRNSEVFKVKTTIAKAEELLQAEYYDYEAIDQPGFIVYRVRMGTFYDVPSHIAPHLDLVTPTHRLPQRNVVKRSVVKSNSIVKGGVGAGAQTPVTLKKLYNVGTTVGKYANNSQAICSFQLEYYDSSDLQQFWTQYGISTDTVINIPSDTPSGYGLEAELDTQYISSLGEKITLQVWYNSGQFENALLDWTNTAMNDPDCPYIFSVSYGAVESYYGGAYINKLNTQLMELGATGVSIFFASGDSGAGGGCTVPPFEPDYPASSPYVTAVGGLQGGSSSTSGAAVGEECWNYGGGGFSNYAPRQSWQDSAVTKYLTYTAGLPPSSDYNSSGRAFPDIAAQSVDFDIVVRGKTEGVSGTSCASPTAAGIFALLNDVRLQNGMAQLGFANPWIYSTAAADATAFNDCTTGFNKGCLNAKGFQAEPAWDACSGYGSPNYGVLATHALKTGVPARKF